MVATEEVYQIGRGKQVAAVELLLLLASDVSRRLRWQCSQANMRMSSLADHVQHRARWASVSTYSCMVSLLACGTPASTVEWRTRAARARERGSSPGDGARRVRGWARAASLSIPPAATAPKGSAGADFFQGRQS
jgi:hypothetical protein